MTEAQIKARIAFLKAQMADIQFPRDVYDKIESIVRHAARHFDDIDPVIFDLDKERVQEIDRIFSRSAYGNGTVRVRLSLLDLFDLERLSLLAERDVSVFKSGQERQWSRQEMAALTASLEGIRKFAFPHEVRT